MRVDTQLERGSYEWFVAAEVWTGMQGVMELAQVTWKEGGFMKHHGMSLSKEQERHRPSLLGESAFP